MVVRPQLRRETLEQGAQRIGAPMGSYNYRDTQTKLLAASHYQLVTLRRRITRFSSISRAVPVIMR